ncbi:unnamed protein product, partial [Rotaria sp. Silwood1]
TVNIHSSVTDTNDFQHPSVFDFELTFFDQEKFLWIEDFMCNWWWLSIPYTLLYIIAMFIGQTWMTKKRNEKFDLRK